MFCPARDQPLPDLIAEVSEYINGCIPWLYRLSGLCKFIMLNLYVLLARVFRTLK